MPEPTEPQGGPAAPTEASDSADPQRSEAEEIQPTPFDHPLFLPAMFAAGCLWFGYDAYLNDDPDMLEHLEFNRFGLRVVAYAAVVTGVQGWAELKDRPVSAWSRVGVHALFAAWFAFDGWLNPAEWYVDYVGFNQMAAGALALTTIGLAVRAARIDPEHGDEGPGLGTAAWVALVGVAFGARVWAGVENGLLFSSTAAGLVAMGFWLARRAWRRRSTTQAAAAS